MHHVYPSLFPPPLQAVSDEDGVCAEDDRVEEEAALRGRWLQPGPLLHQRAHHRHGVPRRERRGHLQEQPRRGQALPRAEAPREVRASIQHEMYHKSVYGDTSFVMHDVFIFS